MQVLEKRFPKTDFDMNLDKEVLKTDEEIRDRHNRGWGGENIVLTKEELLELQSGNAIGWCDGEYTHVILLGDDCFNTSQGGGSS